MTDRTLRDGLWVSTARRALLDATREGADADQLVSAARDARKRAARPGSTDFSTVRPEPGGVDIPRRVATEVMPELREGRLLD